jgi:hypothetical protein
MIPLQRHDVAYRSPYTAAKFGQRRLGMDNVTFNRHDVQDDDLAPLPIESQPGGTGLAMWFGGFLGFAAGAAVVVIAMAMITTENLAGQILTENIGAEILSSDTGVLLGTAVGLLLGVIAGWLVTRRYYVARDARIESVQRATHDRLIGTAD